MKCVFQFFIKITLGLPIVILLVATSYGGEAELFVELEALKNEVKVRGYSEGAHQKITELFNKHIESLPQYSEQLRKELSQLTKASTMIQGLKECVNTNHDVINKSMDSFFSSMVQSNCLDQYFSEPAIEELMTNTDAILGSVDDEKTASADSLRKELFEEGLPQLMANYKHSAQLFKDTDERFLGEGNDLFPLLPEDMQPEEISKNDSSPTYKEGSQKVLGPIYELYEKTYGDRADLALSDRWTDVYTSEDSPHLFPTEMDPEKAKQSLKECQEKAQEVAELQEAAVQHFEHLRGSAQALGVAGLIKDRDEMERAHDYLAFQQKPVCRGISQGIAGRASLDRMDRAIDSNDQDIDYEDLAYSGKKIALTLGNLGEDPHNNVRPARSNSLENRSLLAPYTAEEIKKSHERSLEGMRDFINHMGRRVYRTSNEGLAKQALDSLGDGASWITSLGENDEVDVALLLMANPAQGMKTLINKEGALKAFCDSFKTLRNQRNISQALEIAATLSMFTGVGGMIVKGGTLGAKGLRVTNFALSRVDTISIFDTVTNARDLALSNACQTGDESLCRTYMESDRNFSVALAGLVLAGGSATVGTGSAVVKRYRHALVARRGENVRGLIEDQEKLGDLLRSTNERQRKTLGSLLGRKNLSDEEVGKIIHLIQNSEKTMTLAFLTKLSQMKEGEQAQVINKILEKLSGGSSCKLP